MRMSISILLVMFTLTMIGCASGDAGNSAEPVRETPKKSDGVTSERQKAIDWISKNNNWGTSEGAGENTIKNITNKIDRAIEERKNIFIAIGTGILKSGKATVLHWEDNKFSTRELNNAQVKGMGLPEMGVKSGELISN